MNIDFRSLVSANPSLGCVFYPLPLFELNRSATWAYAEEHAPILVGRDFYDRRGPVKWQEKRLTVRVNPIAQSQE